MIGGIFQRAAAALGVVVGLSILSSCTEGRSNTTHPSGAPQTTSPSSSSSATAESPNTPAGKKTRAGAEAFTRYFWNIYNYGYATNNSAPLAGISSESCSFCNGAVQEINKAHAEELRQLGGHIDPQAILAAPGKITSSIVVNCVVNQDASQVLDRTDSVVSTSKALSSVNADVKVEWMGNAWRMRAVTITFGDN